MWFRIAKKSVKIESDLTLEKALRKFPKGEFKVDVGGMWREKDWCEIDDYAASLSKEDLESTAAIDDNHIAVDLPSGFEVLNLVPKEHWKTGTD
jgi:hypothetical protein